MKFFFRRYLGTNKYFRVTRVGKEKTTYFGCWHNIYNTCQDCGLQARQFSSVIQPFQEPFNSAINHLEPAEAPVSPLCSPRATGLQRPLPQTSRLSAFTVYAALQAETWESGFQGAKGALQSWEIHLQSLESHTENHCKSCSRRRCPHRWKLE